jgi:ATP-dependent helicase/nuclease subunit A
MKATPEQLRAIQIHDRPVFVEAGAGSGKTWVLVQRFLHLLEQKPEWPLESILAVTFTRKATREIRSRLRSAVENQAKKAPPGSHWHTRRGSLERLQVYTIHGLCARLLRENAIEAGIDPLFEELDEREAELLKEEAVKMSLAELAVQESSLLSLLASLKVRDLQNEMGRLLDRRGDVHRLFQSLPEIDILLRRWEEGLESMRKEIWLEEIDKEPLIKQALSDLVEVSIPFPEDKLAASVAWGRDGARLAAFGHMQGAAGLWLNMKFNVGLAAHWGGKEAKEELVDKLKALREAAKRLDASGCLKETWEMDRSAADALHAWKDLWNRLDACYNRIKEERGVLDFDDLEILAERLLLEKPSGERLEAYLKGVNQLMVDEFQDTNQVQQRIVYSLANPQDGGKLFIVGDAKQSIYRFRQAEVSVFNRTGADIKKVTGEGPVVLSASFRSHASLVAALNSLFDTVLQPLGARHLEFEAPPGPLTAHRQNPEPYEDVPAPVEIWLTPTYSENDEALNAEQGRLAEAALLAGRLLELEKRKFPVWDKDQGEYRPFRYGDAAVLFQAGTVFHLYEEQFKAAGLPYVNLSGRGYYDRPEVRDLVSLLLSLYRSEDELSLAAALRSPLFNLNDETLYRLRWQERGNEELASPVSLSAALGSPPLTDQPDAVVFAAGVYKELKEMAWRTPVWKLVRRALFLTGYEAALALADQRLPGGGRQVSNVAKFMQIAREQGGSDLSAFLGRIENMRTREVREGEGPGNVPESGAVQLMSIHAAKGLEFPVVAVADMGRTKRGVGGSPYLLIDPAYGAACKYRDEYGEWQKPSGYCWAEWLDQRMDEAENRRLLYVACTRAADLLMLYGKPTKGETWLSRVLEAWGIPAGGAQDELVRKEGFNLRIVRPDAWPVFGEAVLKQDSAVSPALEMPRLVKPLARSGRLVLAERCYPVENNREQLKPVLEEILQDRTAGTGLAGKAAHRALADWDCLKLPEAGLRRRLGLYLKQEGHLAGGAEDRLTSRILRLLKNLLRDDFYHTIEAAAERFTEIPFSIETTEGIISGEIDLLFKDADGCWNLVDWKTEWTGVHQVEARTGAYQEQMSLYTRAVKEILGEIPKTWLCFLNPRLILQRVENLQHDYKVAGDY